MKSIKSKIIIFAILATLIPSLGLGILSFQQNEVMISENVTRELRALANHASRELDLWTKDQIYIARELSTSKVLIEGLSLTDQSQKNKLLAQQKILEHYLKSVHKKLETVLELTVIDTEGEIVASNIASPTPVPLPQNWPESASIQGNVVIPPHWNTHYTTATLSISVPVLSIDDYILGALIVTFDLRNIQSSLKDSAKSPPGEVLLLDKDGDIMLASNILVPDADNPVSLDSKTLQRLQDNPGEFEIFQGLHLQKVIGLAYTSETPPITIIASRNYESIYAAWIQQRNLFIGLISAILLIVTTIAFRMGHAIVIPLQRLICATEKIVKGDLNVELTTTQRNEMGQLTLMFNQMTDKLRQNQADIDAASTAMKLKNQLLETLSITDSLTGLYNRNKLNLIINDQLARYARNKRPFAVLMIDVDYFKTLNDSLGHIAGDEILTTVAKKIYHCIRSVDFAARYGGDEFILILTETTVDEAVKTAERIRSHVASIYCTAIHETVNVTLSIGIIQSEPEDTSLTILLSRVDSALYEAKHAGRNQAYCMQPKPTAA
ncbi:diguanylate cyclase (GGDEF)-like protein [Nitrosomonas sp. Nm84]|uniref:sensor domain-containing diguanylate cyclase n=1 Tax=Nitrosomonas sp. Nm84 TaxID=200124 RepID=UPI000D99D592|nr:diguanylate cyclase [Nitrosomonas sp. Nm84]PXW87242.1 diguanylate cyclase (GGDEF)-like protein [Nitrosomonas sp. Nm84]